MSFCICHILAVRHLTTTMPATWQRRMFVCPCYFKWRAFWYVSLNFIFIIIDAIHKFRNWKNQKRKKKQRGGRGRGREKWKEKKSVCVGKLWKSYACIHTPIDEAASNNSNHSNSSWCARTRKKTLKSERFRIFMHSIQVCCFTVCMWLVDFPVDGMIGWIGANVGIDTETISSLHLHRAPARKLHWVAIIRPAHNDVG